MKHKNTKVKYKAMGKYEGLALSLFSRRKNEWLATNRIKEILGKETNKSVNWHLLFSALEKLEKENKITRMTVSRFILWKKK
jgi:hypothetical protein